MRAERMAWLIYKLLLRIPRWWNLEVSSVWHGVRLSSQGRRWLPRRAVAFIFVCLLLGALAPCQSLRALHTFISFGTPPPPCLSYALVQATVGVGTVLIWYLILIRYQI